MEDRAQVLINKILIRFRGSEAEREYYRGRLTAWTLRFIDRPATLDQITEFGRVLLNQDALAAVDLEEYLDFLELRFGDFLHQQMEMYLSDKADADEIRKAVQKKRK